MRRDKKGILRRGHVCMYHLTTSALKKKKKNPKAVFISPLPWAKAQKKKALDTFC